MLNLLSKDDAKKLLALIRAVDRFMVHQGKWEYREMKEAMVEITSTVHSLNHILTHESIEDLLKTHKMIKREKK